MNNLVENGLLLTVATAFSGYGVYQLLPANDGEILYGGAALLIGAGIFVLRGYLQKKGYPVGGKK